MKLEKLFRRREKIALPEFKPDSALDRMVGEYLRNEARSVGLSLDRQGFTDEQAEELMNSLKTLREILRAYVEPYLAVSEQPKNEQEGLRWTAAQSIFQRGPYDLSRLSSRSKPDPEKEG